jgi:hypothetical protein
MIAASMPPNSPEVALLAAIARSAGLLRMNRNPSLISTLPSPG